MLPVLRHSSSTSADGDCGGRRKPGTTSSAALFPRSLSRRAAAFASFSAVFFPVAYGFGCFSDYSMSWCNNHTEASCIHDYTFSVSHYQRKLDAYYYENKRPPLLEAYFMIKVPRVYQKEVFLEGDCAPPLIMSFLLVAEARLDFDENAMAYYEYGLQQLELIGGDQRYLLENTSTWPLKKAIAQVGTRGGYVFLKGLCGQEVKHFFEVEFGFVFILILISCPHFDFIGGILWAWIFSEVME